MGLEALSQFECDAEMDPMAGKIAMYWSDPMADVPVKLLYQGTLFQRKVWSELVKIRFGETMTYKELAVRTGSAARAVGGACRANHFPLIIPCHRVVSVSGAGGYAGQEQGEFMSIKLKLLEYERAFNK
jgi:methylated-DNA-[protein]-cysteine S-methyltransferase